MPLDRELLLGHIAVRYDFITPAQLEECLSFQESLPQYKPLGLILIEKGYLTPETLDKVIELQEEQAQQKSKDKLRKTQDSLFGRILIAKGYLTKEQMYASVREQARLQEKGVHKRLGSILHEKGWLTEEQILEALEFQNKRILYCDQCDTIYTVEWVLGRKYACTKCGKRLLVPPKMAVIDLRELVLKQKAPQLSKALTAEEEKPGTETAARAEDLFPKLDLKQDFQRIATEVSQRAGTSSETLLEYVSPAQSFFLFLVRPAGWIALAALGGVIFLLWNVIGLQSTSSKAGGEGSSEEVTSLRPDFHHVYFPSITPADIQKATPFQDESVYNKILPILSLEASQVFPEIEKRGRFWFDRLSGKKLPPAKVEQLQRDYQTLFQNVVETLYSYPMVTVPVVLPQAPPGTLTLVIRDLEPLDLNFHTEVALENKTVPIRGPFYAFPLLNELVHEHMVFFGCLGPTVSKKPTWMGLRPMGHQPLKTLEQSLGGTANVVFALIPQRSATDTLFVQVVGLQVLDKAGRTLSIESCPQEHQ